jgi:two-component system NtrC family sensor kinase
MSDAKHEAHDALFQAVVDAIPVSLYVVDTTFRIVVWNRGREAGPFGKPRGEALGARLFDVVGEDAELRAELERVFATGHPSVSEVEGRAAGPTRLYRIEKIPMRLGRGDEVTHVITFALDVTEQRAMERSMALAEKLAAVGRLAAGIAHEINNPLATIAGCAEAIRGSLQRIDDGETAEIEDDASSIEEEAYRCKDILQSLLDMSHSAHDRREPCDLEQIVERTLRLLRHNPRLASIHVEVAVADDVPSPVCNPDHLSQALMALVLNAADASPAGRVSVIVEAREDGGAAIVVEDDGPGIPSHLRERVFEPFFTTKPPGQGTGLGLSVVYGLLQAQGGTVVLDSRLDGGARFRIELPGPTCALQEIPG